MNVVEQIKQGENKRLELKKTLPSNEAIAKTIVAFSNTSGGKLIIGVNDDLSIEGMDEKSFPLRKPVTLYGLFLSDRKRPQATARKH